MSLAHSMKVSLLEPDSLRHKVAHAVAETATKVFPLALRTIVITGSMARDEATCVQQGRQTMVLGDAEFVLVFHDTAKLPSRIEVERFRVRARAACEAIQVRCQVDCSTVHAEYFKKLPRSIYAYDLLQTGVTVWGDASIINRVDHFPAVEIAREDAWRMVCNRLIELLECLPAANGEKDGPSLAYRLAKLQIDLVTSLLVFQGGYLPGYEKRMCNLRQIDSRLGETIGIPWSDFVAAAENATRQKLGRGAFPAPSPRMVRNTMQYALRICAWELRQLLGLRSGSGNSASLLRLWMRHQTFKVRARGWAYVCREQGWLSSWRHWPRWMDMFRFGSPRYWIYLAAVEAARQEVQERTRSWEPRLPLEPVEPMMSYEAAIREIVRNYKACVVGTAS